MRPTTRANTSRAIRCCALGAALLVCLAVTGCRERDPLEAIRQQQRAGDYLGSVEPLRELLATRPDDPEANFLYGKALLLTQRPGLATWSLRKAMEDPEWLVPAGLQLGFAALRARDFNEVVAIAGQILEREPENLQALLMRAQAHAHWRKDPELALADANRVLELDPEVLEAYEPRILALLFLERLEEASESLAEAGRRLADLDADQGVLAWHCSTTAAFQEASEDLEQARRTWSLCLEAHPTDPEVVSNAMAFYDGQGEPDRSLALLRAAVEGAPLNRNLRVALANRLRLAGDAAGAEAVLREATGARDPKRAVPAWMDLVRLRQALGEHGAAVDAMERALELAREAGPLDPQLSFEYADALVLARQFDRAVEVAEDLPVPAHRHLILARVAQERRHPIRARAEFDEALRLWPDNPWARYYAARAAEELGDFARALEDYRYATRIDPGATDARTRGAALLLATGRPQPALQMLLVGRGKAPLEMEGQLLAMRLWGLLGDMVAVRDGLAKMQQSHPDWAGRALAAAAEGTARRADPAVALAMLASAPGVDYGDPRYAAALRAMLRFSHRAGEDTAIREALEPILAARPDSGALQEIRALDLELSGAPAEEVRAAYERALELEPGNAGALAGLGRLALDEDPEAALGFFDRAAAADPADPEPKLEAVRTLVALGKPDQAAERLDALLVEHPFEGEAAAERARLDLERGIATAQTLERAQRAARVGGGPDALDLVSQVHAKRDEPEAAAQAAERARAIRAARASEG
jgi:tetratricopeptide (TPR) repeat protein